MKKLFLFSFCLLVLMGCEKKSQKLLLAGSGWDKIAIVDKETKAIEWEYPMQNGWECNSLAVDAKGNIVFAYSKGAKLINREKQEIWTVDAPEGAEMQTATVLPDGNYLLAWCGHPATILEVNAKGEIISKAEFETGIENPHAQFRQIIKNKKGNYMVPLFATSEVREIAPSGEQVKTVQTGGTPFSVASLSNGNYLVACGDGHFYIELNYETGDIVRKVNAKDIEGATLFFVAQLLPTKEGGEYICNWQGHDGEAASGKYPQVIEVDKNGKMIWNLNDNAKFGMISSICVVE